MFDYIILAFNGRYITITINEPIQRNTNHFTVTRISNNFIVFFSIKAVVLNRFNKANGVMLKGVTPICLKYERLQLAESAKKKLTQELKITESFLVLRLTNALSLS